MLPSKILKRSDRRMAKCVLCIGSNSEDVNSGHVPRLCWLLASVREVARLALMPMSTSGFIRTRLRITAIDALTMADLEGLSVEGEI